MLGQEIHRADWIGIVSIVFETDTCYIVETFDSRELEDDSDYKYFTYKLDAIEYADRVMPPEMRG